MHEWNEYFHHHIFLSTEFIKIIIDSDRKILFEINYTVRNVRKFTTFLCYRGNVKYYDIYDVFKLKYLKIAKIVLNFLEFFLIL